MPTSFPTAQKLTVMWPVGGVEKAALPCRVADVRVDTMRPAKLRKVGRGMLSKLDTDGRAAMKRHLETFKGVYAETTVEARDWGPAEELARDRIRVVLEVLNFFVDVGRGQGVGLYVVGDVGTAAAETLAYSTNSSQFRRINHTRQGPFVSVSLRDVKAQKHFRAAEALLRRLKPTPVEARVLMALRWAGRASLERNKAHALMFFVFALEALFAGPQAGGDISYRVAVRCSHVLGRTKVAKKRVYADVRKLYDLRSAVAHRGKFDSVTEPALRLARQYAKSSVLRMLSKRSVFRSISQDDDLNRWFDDPVLR